MKATETQLFCVENLTLVDITHQSLSTMSLSDLIKLEEKLKSKLNLVKLYKGITEKKS